MKKTITTPRSDATAMVEAAWQTVGDSFERFCLTAGIAALASMMEDDTEQLCGPGHGRYNGAAIAGHWPRPRSWHLSPLHRRRSEGADEGDPADLRPSYADPALSNPQGSQHRPSACRSIFTRRSARKLF